MEKLQPFVSIVVPAYNEEKFIGDCLESLSNLSYPKCRYEIIVVDNCSKDNTATIAESMGAIVIRNAIGKVGAVRNQGAKVARGEILAFIDADCIAGKNWLKSAIEKLKDPTVGAVGGVYNLRPAASWVEKSWVLGDRKRDRITSSLIGGSFILKKNLFDILNGFDEKINAGEDTRLSKKITNTGLALWFVSDCAVVHLGFPRTVRDFARRQFWHSSSYLKSNNGLKDKTFIAVIFFMVLSLLSASCYIFDLRFISLMLFSLSIMVVLTFSAKRIFFSGYKKINIKMVAPALALDYIYFASRSCGLFVSIFLDPYSKKN